jgi:uncharacterized membrane protein YoaT (DUF817 family)
MAENQTRFARVRAAFERVEFRDPVAAATYEFLIFGFKQAWACLFGALLLALMLVTRLFWPHDAPIARMDFLFLAALGIQVALLALRLETLREAKVIALFHLVGTVMELFKTSVGSWTYPEPALFRIEGVPLFSGFMYASVGSYIARVWRGFEFSFTNYPPLWSTFLLAAAIYVNFFAHHFTADLRLGLFLATALMFWRTQVVFTPLRTPRRMPLLVGWFLVALFIWSAENIATFAHIWTYPHQSGGWQLVRPEKLGAWYLLMIISFVAVSWPHRRELDWAARTHPAPNRAA